MLTVPRNEELWTGRDRWRVDEVQAVQGNRARPGTEAGPQGRGAGQGEPGVYFTNMQPVRPRPQDPPTVADTIWVWPAGSRPTPATVGGDLDFGVGGALHGVRSKARDRGCRTARGRSRGGSPQPVNRMGWKFRQACMTLN